MKIANRFSLCTPSSTAFGLLFLGFATFSGCEQPNETEASPTAATPTQAAPTPAAHAHDKTGETCFICDPSKREKGRMWCKEHARYEDRCWDCHPETRDQKRAYCEKHHLYQDECHLCGTKAEGGTP